MPQCCDPSEVDKIMSSPLELPNEQLELPLLPLRDVVVFPHMVIPLFVGRPKSIKALENAMEADKSILLVAQKSAARMSRAPTTVRIGCVANILQMLKLPDGTIKVLVEGVSAPAWIGRGHAQSVRCQGQPVPLPRRRERGRGHAAGDHRAVRPVREAEQEDPARDSRVAFGHRGCGTARRHDRRAPAAQARAEAGSPGDLRTAERLEKLLSQMETELDILQVEKRIRGRVKRQMEKSQREYYLNEQVKAIQKELGEGEEGADLEEMEKKIRPRRHAQGGAGEGQAEFKKLRLMSPMSAEATVVRNYIETWSTCRGRRSRASARIWLPRRRSSTATTTASRRSRSASSSTSPCSSAWTR
jgi:ATP-dependent Lon protease